MIEQKIVERVLEREWGASPAGYGIGVRVQVEEGVTRYDPIPMEHNMSYMEADGVLDAFRAERDGETYRIIDVLGTPVPRPGPVGGSLWKMVEEFELEIEWSIHVKVADADMLRMATLNRLDAGLHWGVACIEVRHDTIQAYQSAVYLGAGGKPEADVAAQEKVLQMIVAAFYAGVTRLWLEYEPVKTLEEVTGS